MKITKPGIYDIPMETYLGDPCPMPSLSKGIIKAILTRSMKHAWLAHPRYGGESDESSRLDFGTAAHSAIVQGEKAIVTVAAENWRTNAAKAERDKARAAGMVAILEKDAETIAKMKAEVVPFLRSIFGETKRQAEQTILFQIDDCWARTRPDWLIGDCVVDYKTTNNADPSYCIRSIVQQNGYDLQATLGIMGLTRLLEPAQRSAVWIFQEIDPPFACSAVGLGAGMQELAEGKICLAAGLWAKAVKANKFSGYSGEIHWADANPWDESDFEARKAAYWSEADKEFSSDKWKR